MTKYKTLWYFLILPLLFGACTKDQPIILLPDSGVINGGFEYGNLSAWDSGGDARAINLLDTLPAFEGGFMALISTGLDPRYHFGTITQTFRVKEEHEFLSFSWNMVCEEFLNQMHHPAQDYFRVTIKRANGAEQMILHRNTAMVAMQAGAMSNPPGSMKRVSGEIFPNAYMTGWKELIFNVSEYRGEEVTVRFEVLRVTGSSHRICVLIDDLDLIRTPV